MEKRHRLFKNGNFGHTQGHKNPCRYTYLYSFFAVGVKAEYYFDQIVEGMSAVQRTSEAHGIQKRGQLLCLLRIPNLLFCNISKFALLGVGNILQMLVQFLNHGIIVVIFKRNDCNAAVLVEGFDMRDQRAVCVIKCGGQLPENTEIGNTDM